MDCDPDGHLFWRSCYGSASRSDFRTEISNGSCIGNIEKTTVLKLLQWVICMFPYRFQHVQLFHVEDNVSILQMNFLRYGLGTFHLNWKRQHQNWSELGNPRDVAPEPF
ncbi:hypothetical protein TNIN_53581 [Trichonephila inaurata madagascariensis]|uniref:Uncharacterized protein n=1 Tax=Trichonephila inaurata madagascariensis TaxID=2747483 RepID=A0A8X6YQ19_9ARAC|nr:hypothetical protein TNIN_53581 [Trichonephila inaurata madagascariensis]